MEKIEHIQKHKAILKDALDLFIRNADDRFCLSGKFVSLNISLSQTNQVELSKSKSMVFSAISHHLCNILFLCDRLEWFKKSTIQDESMKEAWGRNCSLDIECIFSQYRSLCDQFVRLIHEFQIDKESSFNSGKNKSFSKLYKHFNNPKSKIDENSDILYKLLKSNNLIYQEDKPLQKWFGHMRATRDDIIHSNAQTFVFGNPNDGILFQVFKGPLKKEIPRLDHITYNEHVLFFEKYFSLQFSNLILFAEALASLIGNNHNLKLEEQGSHINGCTVIFTWMKKLYKELEKKTCSK
jgi:hypothetical protein